MVYVRPTRRNPLVTVEPGHQIRIPEAAWDEIEANLYEFEGGQGCFALSSCRPDLFSAEMLEIAVANWDYLEGEVEDTAPFITWYFDGETVDILLRDALYQLYSESTPSWYNEPTCEHGWKCLNPEHQSPHFHPEYELEPEHFIAPLGYRVKCVYRPITGDNKDELVVHFVRAR